MSEDGEQERRQIGLGWMVFCTLLGLAVLTVAVKGQRWWQWQGIWPSILTNAGTALLLAAFLFVLERRFTGRVIRANQRAVRQAAAEVEENLQHRTDELAARIDNLQAQVQQRMRAMAETQDATVAAMDRPTYDTVTAALTEANRLSAFGSAGITVQASADPSGIGLYFRWGVRTGAGGCPPGSRLGLQLEIEARLPPGPTKQGRPYIVEEWRPDDELTDVAARMNARLQKTGEWTNDGTVDWSLTMRNLQRSLDLAITSRRGDTNTWHLNGALFQLVGTDWALTEAGIESRRFDGVVLAEFEFPRRVGPWGMVNDDGWDPAPPEGADPNEWRTLVQQGRTMFPLESMRIGLITSPSWIPYTGQES